MLRLGPISLRALAMLWCSGGLMLHLSGQDKVLFEGSSEGAEVVVNGALEGTEPVLQAIWRGVPGGHAVFQVQHTMAPDQELGPKVDRLVEAGIGAYLDSRIHFAHDGVKADLPAEQMALEIDAMISAAATVYGVKDVVMGLSHPTRVQLDRLTRIDWTMAAQAVNGAGEQDKYLAIYYFVRSQRDELERQLRADLLPLSTVPLVQVEAASPGTTVKVNSTCGTVFDQDNYLCALDLQLADTGGGGIDPGLGNAIMTSIADRARESERAAAMPNVRKRDRWLKEELDAINQRIDRMDQRKELWEMRDRMEDIEDRLAGLEIEVAEVATRRTEGPDNPMANLSDLTGRNITIRFERNSTGLEPDQRVLLNEVFEQLARSENEKVLITGFTDRSGDPAVNLRLSEQRAKAVRNYLLQRGIGADRLLVNYYGDSRSVVRDPGERRVEIEWVR
jgi:outer membrane protein OmpA-like peptidoglycan-associated protein